MDETMEAYQARTRVEINRLKDEIIYLKAKLRTPHDQLMDALKNENDNLWAENKALREKIDVLMGGCREAS